MSAFDFMSGEAPPAAEDAEEQPAAESAASGFDFMSGAAPTESAEEAAPAVAAGFDFMAAAPAADAGAEANAQPAAPSGFDFVASDTAEQGSEQGAGAIDLAAFDIPAPAPGPETPAALDPSLLGIEAPAPAPATPAAIDLTAMMGATAPAPAAEAVDLTAMMGASAPAAGPVDLTAMMGVAPTPAAPGDDVMGALSMMDGAIATAPAPAPAPAPKKKRKGRKIGQGAVQAEDELRVVGAPAPDPVPAPAPAPAPTPPPAEPQAPAAVPVPEEAAPFAAVEPTLEAAPVAPTTSFAAPDLKSVGTPMSASGTPRRKRPTTLEGQITEKERKINTFIEAQIKILADSNRLEKAVVEARKRVGELEEQLEAAIASDDFAKSGEIQTDLDALTSDLEKSAADLKRNEARYNKGEQAKHTQMEILADLRSKQLAECTTARAAKEIEAQTYVADNAERLDKGEDMLAGLAAKVKENKLKIMEDGEKIEAEVAIVEVDVKKETAPEQEKKAAEEAILGEIDDQIAELERQLAAKRDERAVVVGRVEVIEAAIQTVRDKFTEPYKKINADKESLSALEAETVRNEQLIVERREELEVFRKDAIAKRAEYVAAIKTEAEKEEEQKVKVAMVRWYIAQGKEIGAQKEQRDAEEARMSESLKTMQAEFESFTTQNTEYASTQMQAQREVSALRTAIESAERELPELDAQKKLAIKAKNFDEAGRVSEQSKALAAKKEQDMAKRAEIEAQIAEREAANAEVNSKLSTMGQSVAAKEKEVNTYHYATLVQQIKSMKGLMELATEDGEEVAARLLGKQIEVAEQAAAGLAAKDGIEFSEIPAERPTRPAAQTVDTESLDELPQRSISQEEAQELVDSYDTSKAAMEERIQAAVEAEDFGLCTKINSQIKALTEQRRLAGTVLKAAGVEVEDLPEDPEEAAAEEENDQEGAVEVAEDAGAGESTDGAAEQKEPEMTKEEAQSTLESIGTLEKKLETAVEQEDFAQCSALTAEIEGLATKKAQAEAILKG